MQHLRVSRPAESCKKRPSDLRKVKTAAALGAFERTMRRHRDFGIRFLF
jgi:hypothetical protein